ncbi:hypothetical protein J7J37_01880 [bacterium]|nr:hypothetical protein [bacterium]
MKKTRIFLISLFVIGLFLSPVLTFSQKTLNSLSNQLSISEIKVLQKATKKGEEAKFKIILKSKTGTSISYLDSDFKLNAKLLDNQNKTCAESNFPIGVSLSSQSKSSYRISFPLNLNKDCPLPQTIKVSFLKKNDTITSSSLEILKEKSKEKELKPSLIIYLVVLVFLVILVVYLLKIKKINKI